MGYASGASWGRKSLRTVEDEVMTLLPPVLSKHFLSVTPVVGLVPPERAGHAPRPSSSEVEAIFHAPLSLFVEGGASHTYQDITWEQHMYRIHSFDHAGFRIWGLTAGILIQGKVSIKVEGGCSSVR
ncbi:hypothetical protein DUNSADRAFT_167 [Dunaliella salina]|uniref:Uncharacterized protein n=1 Tax=Dunaliella salina TaxID=3046 RepID=A0ABQ7FZG2_DUNSA|nr:hypothetical protein DUNSADRAFT_167 [Dunaliella salina]|eukprot:KAF5827734.1 hypothetical protein DUNSADRAFT_167 [Dunaliella salina]